MGILSRIRAAFIRSGGDSGKGPVGKPPIQGLRRDRSEDRDPASFPRLAEVMRLARQDPKRCLRLCQDQIGETPDYDLPYIWASNFEASAGDLRASLKTLRRGLNNCKRVSGLLEKQGERFLDLKDAPRMVVAFGHAILAQQPPRSKHDEYLYFAYVCLFGDYGNAGDKALAIARRIRNHIDLAVETQREIQRLVAPNQRALDQTLRSLIQAMLEEGRID